MVLLKIFYLFSIFFITLTSATETNTLNSSTIQLTNGLIANFQSNGIGGYVFFGIDGNGTTGSTLINAKISGPENEKFTWKVHSMPAKRGDFSCSILSIGLPVDGLDLTENFGLLFANQETTVSSSSIQITNVSNPFFGRTLVLRGLTTGKVACSTILPAAEKTVYQANFHTPIHGSVTILQSSSLTGVFSMLSFSNGTRKTTSEKWVLVSGSNTDATLEAQFRHEKTRCVTLRGNPINLHNIQSVNIGVEPLGMSGRTYLTLPLPDLTTFSTLYLVVLSNDTNTILACAAVNRIKAKTAVATFNTPEARGSFTFTQESPFDSTTVQINLELFEMAYSYGIDELPMIVRSKDESSRFCPNVKSIIYNPSNIEPDAVPFEGQGTNDQYAVGDLSGKYGNLGNTFNVNLKLSDFNLPMYGKNSIVGRALVIYTPEGPPLACANIELSGVNITTAFATFDTPIQGQFIFRQPKECDSNTDTYVYLEVSKPGEENAVKTVHHQWHIHINPVVPSDKQWSTSECSIAGPHYNPYNVLVDCIYHKHCSPSSPLRCELGDTSSKLNTIDIPPYRVTESGELEIGKYFFTDNFLPLCGPTSIIDKSVIIHEENFASPRLACANIIEYKPKIKKNQQN